MTRVQIIAVLSIIIAAMGATITYHFLPLFISSNSQGNTSETTRLSEQLVATLIVWNNESASFQVSNMGWLLATISEIRVDDIVNNTGPGWTANPSNVLNPGQSAIVSLDVLKYSTEGFKTNPNLHRFAFITNRGSEFVGVIPYKEDLTVVSKIRYDGSQVNLTLKNTGWVRVTLSDLKWNPITTGEVTSALPRHRDLYALVNWTLAKKSLESGDSCVIRVDLSLWDELFSYGAQYHGDQLNITTTTPQTHSFYSLVYPPLQYDLKITNLMFVGTSGTANNNITLTVKNAGASKVTVAEVKVNDVVKSTASGSKLVYEAGETGTITTMMSTTPWVTGNKYKVTLLSATGTTVAAYESTA